MLQKIYKKKRRCLTAFFGVIIFKIFVIEYYILLTRRLNNSSTAEHIVAVIEHYRLTACNCTLRRVEFYYNLISFNVSSAWLLLHIIASLCAAGNFTLGRKNYPVEILSLKP